MNKILSCLAIALIAFPAMADQHGAADAAVRSAIKAFNGAYADNDMKEYFSYYADDPTLYWQGARQDLSAYREEWTAMVDAGGGVEKSDLSDLQVRVLPGGDAAVATYVVDYRLRWADGEIYESALFEFDVWQKIDGEWKVVSLTFSEIPSV